MIFIHLDFDSGTDVTHASVEVENLFGCHTVLGVVTKDLESIRTREIWHYN